MWSEYWLFLEKSDFDYYSGFRHEGKSFEVCKIMISTVPGMKYADEIEHRFQLDGHNSRATSCSNNG